VEPVLWWIIGALLTALGAVLGVALWMAQRWQSRVENRLRRLHHQANLLQWLVFVVKDLYRKVFGREPPPPPKES
jgi:hypothetical protein